MHASELQPEWQGEPTKRNTGREGLQEEDGLYKTGDKSFGVGLLRNKYRHRKMLSVEAHTCMCMLLGPIPSTTEETN